MAAERERIREEERAKAEADAKKRFEDKEKEIELKSQGLRLKSDNVDAALKRLAADKAKFDEERSELVKGIEVKYEKLLEERVISEVKSTLSELKATSVAGLVEVAKKMHQSGKSKERHLHYCLRKVFGSTSEKLHDDEALSLVDSALECKGLETSDKLQKAYKAAKEVAICIKTLTELRCLAEESERSKEAGKRCPARIARWWTPNISVPCRSMARR